MRHWWELFPHRWEREQQALTETGWEWSVDESLADRGVIGFQVAYPLPAEHRAVLAPTGGDDRTDPEDRVWLRVLFPAAYPFFPPSVRDHEHRLRLPRHLEPVGGKLCLLQPTDWVLSMTAAELIDTQLPRMLAAATSSDPPPAGWEVPAAEPLGRYTPDRAGARILIDTSWQLPPDIRQGVQVVGFTQLRNGDLGSGLVKLLRCDEELLETFPDRLGDQFPLTAPGRWLRWDGFTPGMTAAQVWTAVEPLLKPLTLTIDAPDPGRGIPEVEVIGILVPSEVGYRQAGEEWFFAVRHRDEPDTGWRYELYHSAAAGADDVRTRTPATAGLADRRVLLVGVGAIGGTVAVELARAGIGALDLLDGDVVDPATGCRQHAPAIFAGYPKAAVLRHHLNETSPHADVRAHGLTVGEIQIGRTGQLDAHQVVAHLVGRADLVIDAAANPAVSRYLAALAGVQDKTFLHVSATAGAHGGLVAVIPPKRPGCWWCMHYHRRDHTLPFPPAADDAGTVVPVGCAEVTFTGTGADLAGIATHAARVAIDRLTTGHQDPPMRGDLYVAALRDHRGHPIPIRWRTRRIRLHPDCPMRTLHGDQGPSAPKPQAAPGFPAADTTEKGIGAAVAPTPGPRTVSAAADGAPDRKAAAARTLRTQQWNQHHPRGAPSAGRGGAASESGTKGR